MRNHFLASAGPAASNRFQARSFILALGLGIAGAATLTGADLAQGRTEAGHRSTWPRSYTVQRDDAAGVLRLSTDYYLIEHDLRNGGALSRIRLVHGQAPSLLVRPVEARVRRGAEVLSDTADRKAKVTHSTDGSRPVVTVESVMTDAQGRPSKVQLRTRYEYRWGYVKVHREFLPPGGVLEADEITPLATVLAPELAEYGYREGTSEAEGAPPFSFGSNRWGKLRAGHPEDKSAQTPFVPRSMMFVNPGVEGLEWFVGSDLGPWELLPGRRGQGRCVLERSNDPSGLALSVSPLWNEGATKSITNRLAFTFFLAVPLHEGHAIKPWLHTSFNRNRGNWVSADTTRGWAEQGVQTVHCHNDGDYYGDGLFWRDGSYPPYPDMERFDEVLKACREVGIRTATYFSNKELHPSTTEFKENGETWGRKNRKGALQHNFFKPQSEFGVQMCLRSGWLDFLKLSIDRVLKNHPLNGVYYDWNVALFCMNPLHEKGHIEGQEAQGHWDIEELLDLMEWTRERVGPNGLVIIHNTTTPMFVMENFADHIVATEWGYGKWTDRAPGLQDLPLEWSLAGARSRGVISYGMIDHNAPRRLFKVFATQAFLGGVTPWPASPEAFGLAALLKPLGDIENYRFADWRNQAVTLSDDRCASAVYSRPGQAWALLANLDGEAKEITCAVHPEKLPCPMERLTSAKWLGATPGGLDAEALVEGAKLRLAPDEIVLMELR